MKEIAITIMGYPVKLQYCMHERPTYCEWRLIAQGLYSDQHCLLEQLLRMHYSDYIEAIIREYAWYEGYATAQAYSDPGIDDDTPF